MLRWGRDDTNISDTSDSNAFEFAAIQLLHCSFEVRSSFELDETSNFVSNRLVEG
jgi:hypothetical protein